MNDGMDFSQCPQCGGGCFYKQKKFNQAIGCLVILVGIVFVPVTYGISLLVVTLIDWLLYKRVPDMAVCYKCRKEFKHVDIPTDIKGFNHHIAELYEELE